MILKIRHDASLALPRELSYPNVQRSASLQAASGWRADNVRSAACLPSGGLCSIKA